MKDPVTELTICLGSSCFARGNKDHVNEIKEFIKENHLDQKVRYSGTRCFGKCEHGPFVKIGEQFTDASKPTQVQATILKEIASNKKQ
jgi:NADH:ubiquinone oxidoreductase subunit E